MLKNHRAHRFIFASLVVLAISAFSYAMPWSSFGLFESSQAAAPEIAAAAGPAPMLAGVTTNGGSGLNPTYPDLASAITALNAAAITSPVVITADGTSETAPVGGYVITAQGTAANTITISGAGTIVTAGVGTSTTTDGIFKLVGADYVTLQGFTMQESGANVTATTQAEWGVALLYASATNGAQNNTIQNNSISLNKTNLNTWGIYSNTRHTATAVGTTADITNNTTGPNSGNKVYANTISNVNMGIAFIGSGTAANQDVGNDIGGVSIATANTISNWGGAAASGSYVSNSGTSYCIFMNHQVGDNVSYNTITSATISGTAVTLRGIYKDYTATGATIVGTTNITNNTITITDNFTSGTLEHIRSQGTVASTSTANLNNNTILNSSVGGAASSTTMVGIVNSSAWGTLNMNSNVLRGNTSTATTGGFTGVSNTGAIVTNANLNNNQIGNASGNAITFSAATSGTVLGVANSGAASTATVSLGTNDIRGVVHSVAGTSPHTYFRQTGAAGTATVSNNTLTNLNVNTTGTTLFIDQGYTIPSTGSLVINNNSIVTAYVRGGASGSVTFTTTNSTSGTGSVNNYTNNNFSNITVSGTTTITGFNNTDGGTGSTKTVTGNTFNNWVAGTGTINAMNFTYWNGVSSLSNNTITNIASQGTITGVTMGATSNVATSVAVSGNTINNLVSSGTGGSVTGINISNTSPGISISGNTINTLSSTSTAGVVTGITVGGTNAAGLTISKNKIYDLSGNQTGTLVNGINVTAATLLNISNNLIGDLRATAATGLNAINGLNASATATYNVFHNTIYLNSTSSSVSTFGNSCVTFSSTATSLNLRNNILVNLSTPAQDGANTAANGIAAALRRSGGTAATVPANYATTSNNNEFWVNPAAGTNNHTTYVEGTATITNSMNTVAQMKTFMVNRDQASFGEDTTLPQKFLSTTGSSANFLHIDPTVATQIESGGGSGTGITDDYDNQVRNGATPDVGADEFAGIGIDLAPPSVTYTPLGNTASLANRVLTTSITDATGVPTAGAGLPVLYWRINAGAYAPVTATYVSGSTYTFTFGAGVAVTDTVSYYIVAQDTAGTPNVGSTPAGGSGFTINPPAASTPPASPSTYTIIPGISGTKTVGSGGDYATLTAAIAAVNGAEITGPVVLSLTNALYDTAALETFPLVINANNGSSATNTVTIKPNTGVSPTITGSSAASCVFTLNGADYIIFDGSNIANGTTRDMSIVSGNSATANGVVCLASTGAGAGATNNVVKNTNITGAIDGSVSTVESIFGIFAGGSGTPSTTLDGADNDSNTFTNNAVTKVRYGIYLRGVSTNTNDSNTINGNLIGSSAFNTSRISKAGIVVQHQNLINITQNEVRFVGIQIADTGGGTDRVGIGVGDFGWTPTNTAITNATVTRNLIHDIVEEKTFSSAGVVLGPSGTSATGNTVANNMIYNVRANGTAGDQGIGIGVSGGDGDRIVFNSVLLNGDIDPGASTTATQSEACFRVSSTSVTNLTLKNNIGFIDATSNTGTLKHYAVVIPSATYNWGTGGSNNNDWYPGTTGTQAVLGGTGTSVPYTDVTTLTAWRALATTPTMDAAGVSGNPQFLSTTDLHISTVLTTPVESAGVPIIGIANDFDGDGRAGFPDIGADEGTFIAPVANDVQATAFIDPTNGGSKIAGVAFSPQASFTNNGTVNQVNVPVRYRICTDGTCTTEVYNQTTTVPTLNSGATANATFASATLAAGSYTIKAKAELVGDTVPANDEITGTLTVENPLSGSYTVGSGGNYTSLTNNNGIFQAINSLGVLGNITINITSDLTVETGTHALNAIAGGFTVTIQPSGGAARQIIGTNSTTALIGLNGADNVTIDGLNSGGNTLLIRNTGSTPAVRFINDASSNILRNTTIESASSSAVVTVGTGTTTGNDDIQILNNTIRDRSDAAGAPFNGVNIVGSNITGAQNSTITLDNNQIFNFTASGVIVGNSENVTISNNTIYEVTAQTTALVGIGTNTPVIGTNTISGNTIRDMTTSSTFTGMSLSDWRSTTVTRNRIYNIPSTTGSTSTLTGIIFNGGSGVASAVTLTNNFVSMVPGFANAQAVRGIVDFGFGGNTFTARHNTALVAGTSSLTSNSWACLRSFSAPTTLTFENNLCFNNRTGGTGNHFAMGDQSANTGTFSANNNLYVGTGVTLANYFDYGSSSTGTPVLFSAWQTGPPTRDAASLASNPGVGNYTVANMFMSSADLHLNNPTSNPAVGAGLNGGVAVDYDNDPRPATAPDVGADEIVQAVGGNLSGGTYYNASLVNGNLVDGTAAITNTLYMSGISSAGKGGLISLGCTANVVGFGPSSYFVGGVRKDYCGTGTFTYPIGTTPDNVLQGDTNVDMGTGPLPEYSPFVANVTAGTFPSSLTVVAIDGVLPGSDANQSASRYWDVTENGNLTADISFTYLDQDVSGIETGYQVLRRELGITNVYVGGTVNDLTNTGSALGVTNFSQWAAGNLAPTAANVRVSGRVMTPEGAGLRNATVQMTDSHGVTRTAQTATFGYYSFDDVNVGETYIIRIQSRRFVFTPRVIQVNDEISGLDFIADESQ